MNALPTLATADRRHQYLIACEYACEMFPEHDPASAVLAYIVFEGLPLDIEQTLRELEKRL
jgi:hypothetical protein